jgi:hypothetical protein
VKRPSWATCESIRINIESRIVYNTSGSKIRPKKTGKGVEVEASSELHARYQLGKDTAAAGAAYLSATIKLAEVSMMTFVLLVWTLDLLFKQRLCDFILHHA